MKRMLCLLTVVLLASCSAQDYGVNNTAGSAIAGTALGAGLGAIVGSQTGHAGPGIAIGAAAGALGGALVGNSLDSQARENQALAGRVEEQRAQIEENKRLLEELRRRGADARITDRGVVVNLPDVLFEFDRAALTQDAKGTVDEIAGVIRKSPNRRISVEGHTDRIGSDSYNQRLSERRAESVAGALERDGVSRSQLSVRGFGKSHPVATNDTAAGRARNRRVEVIIEN
jgi:outer membrane protein OmpA-like peptidoglycan-associated protein